MYSKNIEAAFRLAQQRLGGTGYASVFGASDVLVNSVDPNRKSLEPAFHECAPALGVSQSEGALARESF